MGYFRKPASVIVLTTVVFALIIASAAVAQRGVRGPGAGNRAQMGQGFAGANGKMAQALGLTDDQKARIKAIVQDHRKQAQDVKASNLAPDQKRARLMEIRKDMRSQIKSVLTPDQIAKAKQMRAKRMQARRAMSAKVMQQLNLTAAQQSRIADLRQASRQDIAAVRNDSRLSDADKQAKIRTVRQTTRQQILSVLTPEQRDKLKSIREQMGKGCAPAAGKGR